MIAMPAKNRIQRLIDQRALAAAGYAGHCDKSAQRQADADVLQVIAGNAFKDNLFAISLPAFGGYFNAQRIVQKACRDRIAGNNLRRCPWLTILPPCQPAAGPISMR
jgi:hypothetical protein